MIGHHHERTAEVPKMLLAQHVHRHQSPDQWLEQTALRDEPRTCVQRRGVAARLDIGPSPNPSAAGVTRAELTLEVRSTRRLGGSGRSLMTAGRHLAGDGSHGTVGRCSQIVISTL